MDRKILIVDQHKEWARNTLQRFIKIFPELIYRQKKDKVYLLNGSVLIPTGVDEIKPGIHDSKIIHADKLIEDTYHILYDDLKQRLTDASTYIAGIILLNQFSNKHPINEKTLTEIEAILEGAYRIEEQEEEEQDEI